METSPVLELRVHVLLDGIPLERGAQIMGQVSDAYEAIGVNLQSTYQEVEIATDTTETRPASETTPAHTNAIMDRAKDAVGAGRPWGTDVVYTMTSDFLADAAGYANCIGGVRFATRAFAVGEAVVDPNEEQGQADTNESAKIATHEIAHLLGAHHHYANCAESEKSANLLNEWAFCTIMVNDIGLASFDWSTLEASVVRAHVSDFAKGASMGPEPVHARELSLAINRAWKAKGAMDSEVASCVSDREVTIQRLARGNWISVVTVTPYSTGNFQHQLKARSGTYRAVVDSNYMVGDTHRETCSAATSPEVRAH
jgi:hypothetical protein